VIGLLGRNGAGKSTLLKVIRGIAPADNKFIRVDGKCSADSINTCMAYLGQQSAIPREFSVRKAISLSMPPSDISSFLEDDMLAPISNEKVGALSTGVRRYLEIKLVLSKRCNFVLLDEPYSGVSPIIAERISELIRISSLSKGIILTDHNYTNVLQVATHLTLLKDGRLHHLQDSNELSALGYLP